MLLCDPTMPLLSETIYCKHCEMWLNGPTQWRAPEIQGFALKRNLHMEGISMVFPDVYVSLGKNLIGVTEG